MNREEAKRRVSDINSHLQQMPWQDFEVMEYQGDTMILMGSIDTSSSHDIEIRFDGVFFVSLPMEWKTDTSIPPLSLLQGDDATVLNRRYQVEQGHHIFRFAAEDFPEDFGCLVCAREVRHRLLKQ